MRIGWFVLFMIWVARSWAQEVPQIITFQPEDYGASSQNWMITQGCDGSIFVANSDGVLRYNGFSWQLIPFEDQRRVRAIYCGFDCKIYCGGYQSFGYLESDGADWVYKSISDVVLSESQEEVWHIFSDENQLFFQSFAEVYSYDYQEVERILPPENIMFGTNLEDEIFFPKIRGGIFRYDQTAFQSLPIEEAFPADAKITGMVRLGEEELLIATQFYGLFSLRKNEIEPLDNPIQNLAKANQINRLLRLSNGKIIIGTIQNGIYILDENLEIIFQINRQAGLTNNTVLALFEDASGDLWVGTDNGLNLIKLSSPNLYFYDRDDLIGNVFEAIEFEEQLFLGTNKGLFVRKKNAPGFKEVPEIRGQVWSFFNEDRENLLIGHNEGTFLYKDNEIRKISNITGGLQMQLLPQGKILQSTYTGWVLLARQQSSWRLDQRVGGTSISFPQYILDDHTIYGFNSNEGLIRQQFSEDFTEVRSSITLSGETAIPANVKPKFFKFKDQIFFRFNGDFFEIQDTVYHSVNDEQVIATLRQNVVTNRDSIQIISFAGGYYRRFAEDQNDTDQLFIDFVLVNGAPIDPGSEPLKFGSKENTIEIQLGNHNYPRTLEPYIYAISNNDHPKYWLPLPSDGKIRLQALQSASYEVLLQNDQNQTHRLIAFEILPPWYASWSAGILYFLLAAILIYAISAFQNKRARAAHDRLIREKEREMEKERILAKNNELEREVNYKSQMLANSTMTLIQKNKMLSELKAFVEDQLSNPDSLPKTRNRLVRMINRNLNSDEDWQIFENNFNQIHHAFMERLSEEYEELDQNDLKLAAFVKIGLQSKEIAPLMNISFRSVENNRSRLRKKLNLSSGENLKDFLMHF